jgi:hypothetical protein
MVKVQYWSQVLLELDTDTGRIRIMQGFHKPAEGMGFKAPKKEKKVVQDITLGEAEEIEL